MDGAVIILRIEEIKKQELSTIGPWIVLYAQVSP